MFKYTTVTYASVVKIHLVIEYAGGYAQTLYKLIEICVSIGRFEESGTAKFIYGIELHVMYDAATLFHHETS